MGRERHTGNILEEYYLSRMNNAYKKHFKSIIRNGDREIDVSDRKIILYGAGKGLYYLKPLVLFDVEYVVDSDKSVWGKRVYLYDKEYNVVSPELLASLNPNKYYVIVTVLSNKAYDAITGKIKEYDIVDREYLVAHHVFDYGKSNLSFWYDSMESMLMLDSNMRYRIDLCYQSAFQLRYIDDFRSACIQCFGTDEVEGVCPVRLGYGLVFRFVVNGDIYIYKRAKTSRTVCIENGDNMPSDSDNEIIDLFRKNFGDEERIVVYNDNNLFQIQRAALDGDEIEWDDAMIEKVITKIRYIHGSGLVIAKNYDIMEYVERPRKFLSTIKEAPWREELDRLEKLALVYYEEYSRMNHPKVLSHSDLGTHNIVVLDDEPIFIDWEAISMQDPFYDVCKFINTTGISSDRIYRCFRHILEIYQGTSINNTEYLRATKLLLVSAWFELLYDIEKTPMLEHHDKVLYVKELYSSFEGGKLCTV